MGEPATKKAKTADPELDAACIETIGFLSVDQVQAANSGHPGAPLGMATMAYALWSKIMRYNPKNAKWINRDRFVLSNGHSCALQYSMLYLTGYERPTLDDLKQFRQLDSVTAGHPENELLDAVEVSTGPLGSGISNAVGLAMAAEHMAAEFNEEGFPIIDNHTYVFCGDGCMQEGIASEACSMAGHQKLGNLIVLYDDNHITIDGDTSCAFTEDVTKRFEAYGWHVLSVENGNSRDPTELIEAIEAAKACTDKPSFIRVKTVIGYGAKKQGTGGVHGAPLGVDEIKRMKEELGLDGDKTFEVPENVLSHMREAQTRGEEAEAEWTSMFEKYKAKFPEKAAEFERRIARKLPEGVFDKLPKWTPEDKALATRASSGKVLNAMADAIPELVGGSADLTGSNSTALANATDFQPGARDGRYFRFGVREHGMSAMCNGLAAYGSLIPFGATFLVFAGYMLGSVRLSALSGFQVLYILTHDSCGVGEDGPTHIPIETLATLRAIPNLTVFRPADATEVAGSYKAALLRQHGPSAFALTRQGVPNLAGSDAEKVALGAYTVAPVPDGSKPKIIIVGTGSEVQLAVAAAKALVDEGIPAAAVSMPCWELFEEQSKTYQEEVFVKGVPVLGVEAGCTQGWAKYVHYQHGINTFGKSGPGGKVMEHFGFTEENVLGLAKKLLERYKDVEAPALIDAHTLM
ncbi:Transketolase [Hondaea fermentalgiana]|uniref:transketolase n=1 Tax=Hondaea fermentalgiana TaxID=2315210 RepID=A0A2R5GLH4_9STRA|nr:Transketolase [Hondaea fermentalgiana]|eukprot:GBG29131.1 Transketolase [Hondaea fermentalgiana]